MGRTNYAPNQLFKLFRCFGRLIGHRPSTGRSASKHTTYRDPPLHTPSSASASLRHLPLPRPWRWGRLLGCVLNWGGGFLGELIWSLNSPLDCPEPNARPTGLRPSIHPHPPPLRFGTFPYRALGAGEGFWGWCLLEASAEIVSEALAQYFTQGLALLGGEQTRGEEIDILDAGVEHVQAADLKDAGELL